MAFELQTLNPLDRPDWDDLLAPFPGASIFHTAAWARTLVDGYGYAPRYVAAMEQGRLAALLPLMEVSSWLTGRRGVSLPFTDYCEPLYTHDAARRAVIDEAMRIGAGAGWKHIEFRSEECFGPEAAPSLTYWRHTVALETGEEAMFARLKGTVRTAIRKAIGEGVKVEMLTTLEAVRDFSRLNDLTRRAHGLPPQPFSFFRSLHRNVIAGGSGVVARATIEGRPVGACVYFFRGPRAIYKYGASDRAFQHLRANDLVMWEAMRWLAGRGCTAMSMGKTAKDNDGLRRFKLGWGATESELRYFKYDFRAKAFAEDHDAIAGWHNAVFRRMPLPLSRVAGALLYRHMA
jgi:hypothetical protein